MQPVVRTDPEVRFDEETGELFLKYAKMVVERGYVHNSLGNMAIRMAHPKYEHGVAYTKHAEVSLEEMAMDNVVITDIPTPTILYGSVLTSVGHNLNREILRLRPDIHAVIHVHDNTVIAFFASGAFDEIKVISNEFPYVMAKPPHYVPSNVNVEEDVGPIKDFIQGTNSVVMLGHGVTTLGRHVSEAFHRLTALTSEVNRNILAAQLASLKGTQVQYWPQEGVDHMYEYAENVIYPQQLEKSGAGG